MKISKTADRLTHQLTMSIRFHSKVRCSSAHFRSDDNVSYQHHVFRHLRLQQGESADRFCWAWKRKFDILILAEDNLRDCQLIEMLPDLDWKKKLLEVKHISLQEAMDKVCLWESAREQAQMAYHNQDVGASTNAVKAKQVKTCFNCGKEGHFVRDSKCP